MGYRDFGWTTERYRLWKQIEIKRYTFVNADKYPYDGDDIYWITRRVRYIER